MSETTIKDRPVVSTKRGKQVSEAQWQRSEKIADIVNEWRNATTIDGWHTVGVKWLAADLQALTGVRYSSEAIFHALRVGEKRRSAMSEKMLSAFLRYFEAKNRPDLVAKLQEAAK